MSRELAIKAIIVLFLIAGVHDAMALEGRYEYFPINWGWGWYPFTCFIDHNTAPAKSEYSNGAYYLTCPQAKECPFGPAAYHGNDFFAYCNDGGKIISRRDEATRVTLTIPEDIKIVSSDGFVMEGDVCPGETPVVTTGKRTGEWWKTGGTSDSPPIQWVDDAVSFAKELYQNSKENTQPMCVPASKEIMFTDEYGISVYPNSGIEGFGIGQAAAVGSYLATVCSLKEKGTTPFQSGEAAGNEIDIEADVLCFQYYYARQHSDGMCKFPEEVLKLQMPSVIYRHQIISPPEQATALAVRDFKTVEDLFKAGTIKFQKKLKVVQPTEARLDVKSFAGPAEGSERLARFVVTNRGTGKASIGKLTIRGKEIRLTCDDRELQAGESAECVAILDRNDKTMRLAYSEQPCGKPSGNVIAINLDIGSEVAEGQLCDSGSDCSTGEECCVNICRPAAEGVCDDIDSDGVLDTWVPFEG